MKKSFALICAILTAFFSFGCNKENEEDDIVKLTWWVPLFQHVGKTSSNFSDNEFYKELMKRTGVQIEFIHPKGGETFETLLMSDDLPDLIEYSFFTFKGGPQAAIDQNVILGLDSFMEKHSPNYTKILKDNPLWDKEVTTANGTHYTYAWIRGDESLLYWEGLQVRDDLLKQAKLPVPVTIEDWNNTLVAFKNIGVKYPLSYRWSFSDTDLFASAFNTTNGYYQLDGKVKFSPIEEEYKEYVLLLNRWYEEGLLDPGFFSQSIEILESKVSDGQVGAFIGTLGGNMGNCLPKLKKTEASLKATPVPVKNIGDKVFQTMRDNFYQPAVSVSISSNCENVEAAARLLDYGYSEEGHLLYNFGIEGVSYEVVEGYPKYLPAVTDNPDGLSMQHAMSKYMASAYGGPFIQDKREYEQYLRYPEQKEAMALWSKEDSDHLLPLNLVLPAEIENKVNQINNYCSKMIVKFIVGEIPMSQYDSFVDSLKAYGLDEVIANKQKCLDELNSKK